jgi:hypothetical protein
VQAATNHILQENAPHRREPAPATIGKPQFVGQFRDAECSRHYCRQTKQFYAKWVKRFIFFYYIRHLVIMTEAEISAFLACLSPHTCSKEATTSDPVQELLGHNAVKTAMI